MTKEQELETAQKAIELMEPRFRESALAVQRAKQDLVVLERLHEMNAHSLTRLTNRINKILGYEQH